MNGQEYVKNAVKTESRDFAAIGERMKINKAVLLARMEAAIEESQGMDDIKKLAFYGKTPKQRDSHGMRWKGDVEAKLQNHEIIRLLHAAIGICTEAGEMLEQLRNHIYFDQPLDKVNLAEEQGDGFWYMAIMADTLGASFDATMARNIEKLKARYGEKFTEDKAVNRDLKVEREILEKHE